jgi:hypothetical protein
MQGGGTYRRGRTVVHHHGRNNGSGDNCATILLVLLGGVFLVAVPFMNISNETALLQSKIISQKVEDNVVDISQGARINDIVHMEGASYDSTVHDAAFNVNINHGLNLKRNTEYCQWKEISSSRERCQGSGERKECVTETTYHYVKGWTPFRVNSFLFDQPAAHHNPQRDPYPSSTFTSLDLIASVGNESPLCEIEPSVLESAKGSYRALDFTLGAIPHPPSFLARMWSKLFGTSTDTSSQIRYEDISLLQGAQYSKAATSDGFFYVGQGGYFFSPYQESMVGKLSKAFFGYLEGSLFDWQFGDLMPSCTAGDIRVKYHVQDPDKVSILGIVNRKARDPASLHGQNELVRIGSSFTPEVSPGSESSSSSAIDMNLKIGYAHEGSVSSQYMMEAVVYESWLYVLFTRMLLLPWSYVSARILGAFFGYELRSGQGTPYATSLSTIIIAVIGIWAAIVGCCEFMVNNNTSSSSFVEFDNKTQHSSGVSKRIMFLLAVSLWCFVVVDRNAARTNSYGFGDVLGLVSRKSGGKS